MNPMGHMKDPAAGMPPQLLAHMHLISKHRYPVIANPSLEMIVGFLMEAPKIVRDVQPVQWQFLDGPQDGSLFLTWQPLEYLGTNFASDGYVWADAEQPFTSEVQGYKLEIIMHRSGFKAGGEALACHSRKRYRLLPSNNGLGLATPDPALWLVHYTRAATRDHIAAAAIPLQPQIQAQLQQRRVIQTTGQLARKEFMLHDRANWPIISPLPSMTGRPGSGQMIPGGGHRRGGSMDAPVGHPTVEEEEDVSRGDALDLVTPREISRVRYEQHHEWMEEVVESPYNIYQIIPSSLGLGRAGELESLTRGFFEAPMSGANPTTNGVPARVGKMDAGKAAEFTELAALKVAAMQKELEDMKTKHTRRMKKLRQTSVLADAEKKLRTANDSGEPGDADKQELGSSTDDVVRDVEVAWGRKIDRVQNVSVTQRGGVEDPAPRLQPSMSARTMSGTSQHGPFGSGSFGQATPGLEQRQSPMQQQQGFHQQPTPRPQAQAQAQAQPPSHVMRVAESAATMIFGQQEIATIASETEPQPRSTNASAAPTSQPDSQADADANNPNGTNASDDIDMAEDINMDSLDDAEEPTAVEVETHDWVMVDEHEHTDPTPETQKEPLQSEGIPPNIQAEPARPTPSLGEQAPIETTQVSALSQSQPQTQPQPASTVSPAPIPIPIFIPSTAPKPPHHPPSQGPTNQPTTPLPPSPSHPRLPLPQSHNRSSPPHSHERPPHPLTLDPADDFDDMDTAGDALAQYGDGDDEDLDLDNMDDSAFGDAFHPSA